MEYETLLRAFDKENATFAKRVGKDRAVRTYRKYLVVRKYVAEFIKFQYKRSDMAMNELTEEFIRDFCLYLKNVPSAATPLSQSVSSPPWFPSLLPPPAKS